MLPHSVSHAIFCRIRLHIPAEDDCQKLYSDWGVSVRNCVNLSLMARSVDNARWKGRYTNPIGLSRLLETYDMTTLAKGKVQRSNWENFLTKSQQVCKCPILVYPRLDVVKPFSNLPCNYIILIWLSDAANDAHAAYTIYDRLLQLAQVSQPVLHPIYYSFDCIGGALLDPHGHSWVPHNPNYDPGPPPPPKEPKEKPSAQNQLSLSLPGEMHSVIPISDQAPTSSISSTAKASQYHMVFATSTSTLDQ